MNDFIKKHFLPDRFALTSELHGWLVPQINVCACEWLSVKLCVVRAGIPVCDFSARRVLEFSDSAASKDFF